MKHPHDSTIHKSTSLSGLNSLSSGRLSRRAFCKSLVGGAVAAAAIASSRKTSAEAAEQNKIRLAIVGGNFGATFWWHEHPNCMVTAVTDLILERRQRLVASYGREESIRARGKPKTVAVRYARRRRKAATERTTSPTPIQMIVLAHLRSKPSAKGRKVARGSAGHARKMIPKIVHQSSGSDGIGRFPIGC